MSKLGNRYAAEFRRQMVELVRAGRGPEELAREFELSARSPGRICSQRAGGSGGTARHTGRGAGWQPGHLASCRSVRARSLHTTGR